MSEGLEALEEMGGYSINDTDFDYCVKDTNEYAIVEKELKRLEKYEEILNDYGLTLANFREACLLLAMLKGEKLNIHNIAKQLKAFEIIKKKKVDIVGVLLYAFKEENGCDFYNSYMSKEEYKLTQEEYDLLKGVLINKEDFDRKEEWEILKNVWQNK